MLRYAVTFVDRYTIQVIQTAGLVSAEVIYAFMLRLPRQTEVNNNDD